MCSTGNFSSFYLPPLSQADIQSLQTRGSQALGIVGGDVSRLAKSDHRIGVGATPNGLPLYISIFGAPNSLQADWDVVLHIPLGPTEVVLYVKNVPADKKLHMKAVLLLSGAAVAEAEFDISYGDILPFNNVGFVENITVKSNHPSITDSCLAECIMRHAPSCVGPCVSDPTGWSCIICAGGSIACCLINCHC